MDDGVRQLAEVFSRTVQPDRVNTYRIVYDAARRMDLGSQVVSLRTGSDQSS